MIHHLPSGWVLVVAALGGFVLLKAGRFLLRWVLRIAIALLILLILASFWRLPDFLIPPWSR